MAPGSSESTLIVCSASGLSWTLPGAGQAPGSGVAPDRGRALPTAACGAGELDDLVRDHLATAGSDFSADTSLGVTVAETALNVV